MEVNSNSSQAQLRSLQVGDRPSTSRAHEARTGTTENCPPTPKEHFHRSDSLPKLEDLIAGDTRLEELLKGDSEPSKSRESDEGDNGEEGIGGLQYWIPEIGCDHPGHTLRFLAEPPYSCGSFLCNMCTETCTGRVYHCEICKFDLCLSCASLANPLSAGTASSVSLPGMNISSSSWQTTSVSAQEVTSIREQPVLGCGKPYHSVRLLTSSPYETGTYTCNLCRKGGEEEVYHCMSCRDFDLHPQCGKIESQIKSFGHPHELILLPQYSRLNAICDGCLKCLGGSKWVYRCHAGCDYDLHALCAKFARNILHPIHADHELVLLNGSKAGPNSYIMCDGCDRAVDSKELIYHCETCGFDLHPSCAVVPDVVRS